MQQRLLAIFEETPTAGPDKLEALDQEVDAICALALKHITQETMEAEEFQVFAGAAGARQTARSTALSGTVPYKPSCSATAVMACRVKAMCSSNAIPRSATPR